MQPVNWKLRGNSEGMAIARGYLAASERADATAVQAALQAFLADRLSGGYLH